MATICTEHQLSQSQDYRWRDQCLAHAAQAVAVSHQSRREAQRTREIQQLQALVGALTNSAYIGQKEINKCRKGKAQSSIPEELRYRLVDAVWPAIVDADKFRRVQEILKLNHQHGRSGVRDSRHVYLLNNGNAQCIQCRSPMEGRSARGRHDTQYFYYACRNAGCRFRMTERAVENAARDLILRAVNQTGLLERIVEKTNVVLQVQLPALRDQQREVEARLAAVNAQAQRLLEHSALLGAGEVFAKEELERLARQRRQLEEAQWLLGTVVEETTAQTFDRAAIQQLLGSFQEIFQEDMKPYQRRALLGTVLARVELSPKELKVNLKIGSPQRAISPPVANRLDANPAIGSGSYFSDGAPPGLEPQGGARGGDRPPRHQGP